MSCSKWVFPCLTLASSTPAAWPSAATRMQPLASSSSSFHELRRTENAADPPRGSALCGRGLQAQRCSLGNQEAFPFFPS